MNTDPNMSKQSGQTEQSGSQNHSPTIERTKKQVQNPIFIGPSGRFVKNQPKNVVAADIGIY